MLNRLQRSAVLYAEGQETCSTTCSECIAQRKSGAHCSTGYEGALCSESRLETCPATLSERNAQRDYQERDAQLALSGA